MKEFRKSAFIASLVTYFQSECVGKGSCSIPFNLLDINKECLDEIVERSTHAFYTDLFDYFKAKDDTLEY
jgi:hypothetical protein